MRIHLIRSKFNNSWWHDIKYGGNGKSSRAYEIDLDMYLNKLLFNVVPTIENYGRDLTPVGWERERSIGDRIRIPGWFSIELAKNLSFQSF